MKKKKKKLNLRTFLCEKKTHLNGTLNDNQNMILAQSRSLFPISRRKITWNYTQGDFSYAFQNPNYWWLFLVGANKVKEI